MAFILGLSYGRILVFINRVTLIEQAHNLAKLNPRLEAALKERAALSETTAPPKTNLQQELEAPKPTAPVNAGLKGVSQSLIDKVWINRVNHIIHVHRYQLFFASFTDSRP